MDAEASLCQILDIERCRQIHTPALSSAHAGGWSMAEQAKGWFQCPSDLPLERYFDGRCWTDRTRAASGPTNPGWHAVAAAFQGLDIDWPADLSATTRARRRVPRQASRRRLVVPVATRRAGLSRVPRQAFRAGLYVPVRAGEPPPALTAGEGRADRAGLFEFLVPATAVLAQTLLLSAVGVCSLLVSAVAALRQRAAVCGLAVRHDHLGIAAVPTVGHYRPPAQLWLMPEVR